MQQSWFQERSRPSSRQQNPGLAPTFRPCPLPAAPPAARRPAAGPPSARPAAIPCRPRPSLAAPAVVNKIQAWHLLSARPRSRRAVFSPLRIAPLPVTATPNPTSGRQQNSGLASIFHPLCQANHRQAAEMRAIFRHASYSLLIPSTVLASFQGFLPGLTMSVSRVKSEV